MPESIVYQELISSRCSPTFIKLARLTWLQESHGHIKRIALGVPEDKWDSLFQDIIRVMKPGAAFEMLEEDLFFPGKSMDSDDELDLDSDSEKRSSFLSSHRTSTQSQMIYFEGAESEQPLLKAENSFSTATTTTFPATPSRSSSPAADIVVSNDFTKEAQELLAQAIGDYVLPLQEATMPNNTILNDNLSPTTIRGHSQLKISPFTGSTLSLNPAAIGKGAPTNGEGHTELKSKNRSRAYSLSTSASVPDISSQRTTSDNQKPASHVPPVPLLLRTIPKAPPNPRDHSLLEGIYTQLLGSRFINISPLALLANYVGFYFQDVRTHPPLQYHFPALSRKRPCSDTEEEEGDSESEDASSDDARDAILPSPISRSVRRQLSRRSSGQNRNDEDGQITEENRYVGVQGILHHSTPYITLDETRSSALSPSLKGLFPSISSAQIQRSSFLPNTTMHLDLKTLNLHLALRTAEIVACSESMWEWVRKFQADAKARRERDGILQGSRPSRSGSGSVEMPARISTVSLSTTRSSDPMEAAILDLTRDDFDALVGRFEMDMRDQCNLKNALGERFSWLAQEFSASQDRETFEKACEKWDRWQEEQLATTPQTRSHTNHSPRAPSGPYLTSYHLSSDSNAVLGEPNLRKRSSVSTTRSSVTSIPSRRLSRAMRVFVAWKSREIPLEDL
ncbi:hypothetical protein H0H93_003461 [Arthromyces matolae]|nr:hypothetical protein H0H93_003461 [Arthromyces matolae]